MHCLALIVKDSTITSRRGDRDPQDVSGESHYKKEVEIMTEVARIMKSSTTPNVQGSVSCPLSASQAYRLGVNMHTAIIDIYTVLAEKCSTKSDHKVIKEMIKQEQDRITALEKGFSFALNCEMGRFYASGGTKLEEDQTARLIANTRQLIQRNLDNCRTHIETLEKEVALTKVREETITVVGHTKEYVKDLYQRLAQLYPEGEISRAFEDMAYLCK